MINIVSIAYQSYFIHEVIFFTLADNFRPYLTSFQGNSYTDYINAVFVDVSLRFIFVSC